MEFIRKMLPGDQMFLAVPWQSTSNGSRCSGTMNAGRGTQSVDTFLNTRYTYRLPEIIGEGEWGSMSWGNIRMNEPVIDWSLSYQ